MNSVQETAAHLVRSYADQAPNFGQGCPPSIVVDLRNLAARILALSAPEPVIALVVTEEGLDAAIAAYETAQRWLDNDDTIDIETMDRQSMRAALEAYLRETVR